MMDLLNHPQMVAVYDIWFTTFVKIWLMISSLINAQWLIPIVLPKIPQISDPPSQFRSSVSRFDSTSTSSPPISRSCFVMESLESDENASKMGTTWKEKQKEENGKALEFPCEWFLGESQFF